MTDFERIKMVLEYLGISANRLSKEIKLSSPQIFYDIKAGRCGISKDLAKKIQEKFINIDAAWLLTGIGTMIKTDEKKENVPERTVHADAEVAAVPLVDIKSVGCLSIDGESAVSWGAYSVSVPFLNCRHGDLAIYQYGDSMAPVIPAGSILHIRQVNRWREYIGYGNDFVVVLSDGRRLTKQIIRCDADPERFLVAHSYNKDVADEELPKDLVSEVWKVISIISSKGW